MPAGSSATPTGRPVLEGAALTLALILVLTCRCAMNLQMSLRWSDMTKGSRLGASRVAAVIGEGALVLGRAVKREEAVTGTVA